MSNKHTPGPWKVQYRNEIVDADGNIIAYTDGPSISDEAANARLIAEAPELLAALKEIVALTTPTARTIEKFREIGNALNRAHAAIAKAEGEQ